MKKAVRIAIAPRRTCARRVATASAITNGTVRKKASHIKLWRRASRKLRSSKKSSRKFSSPMKSALPIPDQSVKE